MIKANASLVISNFGGDAHGHLGLVLLIFEYNNITGQENLKLMIILHYKKQSSFAKVITKNSIYFAKRQQLKLL